MTKPSRQLDGYSIDASRALVSDRDPVLAELARENFRVRRYDDQAAIDDDMGLGRVPAMPLLHAFADRQDEYSGVLRGKEPERWGTVTSVRLRREQKGVP
jgi:hypothetical protein